MTEKNYGGAAPFRKQGKGLKEISGTKFMEKEKKAKIESEESDFEKQKILKSGKIASQVRELIMQIVKKDVLLVEIADKIEDRIVELGGKPAFPTNLSINDIAAHYTPSFEDKTKAHGLLKIDFGVHIDGWIADTSTSIDLDNTDENKTLIKAAEEALANALKIARNGVTFGEIGKEIQRTIESYKAYPIINLSGHSVSYYDLHSGATIPNYDNGSKTVMEEGTYAIEPFATFGNGRVYDGKPSGIYSLVDEKNVRSPIARMVLDYIIKEYSTLPFCSRWIVKKFGQSALFGLKQLEDNGNLNQFDQLIEVSHKNVAQAEHTLIVEKDKILITTK
ncbi:MAG: type II methionyl aminopeptidase [Candidatus Nanoarchaeia archaeon]